jgi:hypothetical protein
MLRMVLTGLCGVLAWVLPVEAEPRVGVHTVTPPSPLRLPLKTVFKGEARFQALVVQAQREQWLRLPLGARTV